MTGGRAGRTGHVARLVAVVVVTALLLLGAWRLDLARVVLVMGDVRIGWIAGTVACFMAIIPLWAVQWMVLAPPSPRNRFSGMLGVVAVVSTLLNTTVLLMGEAAGIVLLVNRIGLERSAALSLFAMDQLVTGLSKLAVVAAAARVAPLPEWMAVGVTALIAGVMALLAGALAVAWSHTALAAYASRLLPPRAAPTIANVGRALAPLRSPRRSAAALALACAKLAVEVAAVVCVQRAFGAALPPSTAVVIVAALGIATAIPVVPGHLGTYEAVVVFVYGRLGVPAEVALGMALVQHACQFAALALPGYRWIAAVATPSSERASR